MFLHAFHPSPILLSLGPVSVHWYGLLMVGGIGTGYLIARRTFRAAGLSREVLELLLTPLIIGGFLGARLYHVLNELPYYLSHPLEVVAVWNGGLAIHGALIGGAIALYWFARRGRGVLQYASPWLLLADLLTPSLALGQAIGRWGNYFNQELYGKPTQLSWGIPIDLAHRMPGYEGFLFFHPTFLYESLWLLVTYVILLSFLQSRLRPTPAPLWQGDPSVGGESPLERGGSARRRRGVFPSGFIFFLYLILAGLGRFFMEFLRIDAMPYLFGVRLQQVVSVIIVAIGIGGVLWLKRRHGTTTRAHVSQ